MKGKNYFLVGMPASGKSTIGKLLAGQLRLEFYDLDKIIASKEGKTITEIFEEKGEDYFREIERDCLTDFVREKKNYILATGGGAPCFFDNMQVMNDHGVTIFLNVDINDLYNKLVAKDNFKRPLLKGKSPDQLREELFSKYEARKVFYNQSKICLEQRLTDKTDRVNQLIFAIQTLEK